MKRMLLTLGVGLTVTSLWLGGREMVPTVQASSNTVTWEAEDANNIEAPFAVKRGRRTDRQPRPQRNSGAGYIEIPDKANGSKKEGDGSDLPGVARYRVNVPVTGQYVLWGRVLWPDGCGNSFFVRRAGGQRLVLGEDGTYDAWHWVKLKGPKLALQKGVQVIEVLNREDGVLLDMLQITTTDRVPVGTPTPDSNALAR